MLKLSFIKSGFPGIILLLISSVVAYGQVNPKPKPDICTNTASPAAGYKYAERVLNISPTTGCIPDGGTSQPVNFINKKDANTNLLLTNVQFFLDVPKNFDINNPGIAPSAPANIAGNLILTKNMTPGWYWVVMEGVFNAQKYYTCDQLEIVQSNKPATIANTCGTNSITVTLPTDNRNKYDRYWIDWGDGKLDEIAGNTLPAKLTHSYTGTYVNPKIVGSYMRNSNNNFCASSPVDIDLPSSKPVFMTELTGENEGTEAKLKFVDFAPGVDYEISGSIDNGTGTGTFTKMAVGQNGTATLTGLSPQNKYCFKASYKDACGVSVESQNIICSIKLDATLTSSSEAYLKWNLPTLPSGVPSVLRLYKDVVACGSCLSQLPLATLLTTTYSDKGLQCTSQYLYNVEARYSSLFNGTPRTIIIKSAQIKVDPKNNKTPISPKDLVEVGYDPNDEDIVKINISPSSVAKKYQFFRAEANSSDFISVGSSTTNIFDDISIVNKNVAYCYKYKQEDECGTTSDFSPTFCTILLGSNQPGSLGWEPFEIPKEVYKKVVQTTYWVEMFDPDYGTNGQYVPQYTTKNLIQGVQNQINSSDEEQIKFRIKSIQTIDTDTYSNIQIISYSNTYTFTVPPRVYAPTAFTPDGAGPPESETFRIFTRFVADGTLTIYDSWGSVLFSSDDLNAEWKGTQSNGITPAPSGTYAYKVRGRSTAGKSFSFSGSILLLR